VLHGVRNVTALNDVLIDHSGSSIGIML